VSKSQAARARQAFNSMLDEREAAKRARRPVVRLGEPVVVLMIIPGTDPMKAIHAAADAMMDMDQFNRDMDASRAELAAILADGGGPVERDSELLAQGSMHVDRM
jgi:hypothetical protein